MATNAHYLLSFPLWKKKELPPILLMLANASMRIIKYDSNHSCANSFFLPPIRKETSQDAAIILHSR